MTKIQTGSASGGMSDDIPSGRYAAQLEGLTFLEGETSADPKTQARFARGDKRGDLLFRILDGPQKGKKVVRRYWVLVKGRLIGGTKFAEEILDTLGIGPKEGDDEWDTDVLAGPACYVLVTKQRSQDGKQEWPNVAAVEAPDDDFPSVTKSSVGGTAKPPAQAPAQANLASKPPSMGVATAPSALAAKHEGKEAPCAFDECQAPGGKVKPKQLAVNVGTKKSPMLMHAECADAWHASQSK